MGQFDSFTQSVGDSFVGLIGSVGRNIVCPVGCAVCAVMCIFIYYWCHLVIQP